MKKTAAAKSPSGISFDAVYYWTGGQRLGEWEAIHTGPGQVAAKVEEIERSGRVALPGRASIGAPEGAPSVEAMRTVGVLVPAEAVSDRPIVIAIPDGPFFVIARDAVAIFETERGAGPRLLGNLDHMRLMPALGRERYLALRLDDVRPFLAILERMGAGEWSELDAQEAPSTRERLKGAISQLASTIQAMADLDD